MATPRRIYRIYHQLGEDAAVLRDFLQAKGDKVPGTVNLLCTRDAGKLLAKWGDEMGELCGVLDGTHDDPYAMESTQTFYWASLYGTVQGASWEDLEMDAQRSAAAASGIDAIPALRHQVERLVAAGPAVAKPGVLFRMWWIADLLYRRQTPAEQQISIEQLMEIDYQEMRTRPYLEPLLRTVPE